MSWYRAITGRNKQNGWAQRGGSSSRKGKKIICRIGLAFLIFAALFLLTFAIPVHTWRTGEMPAPPLSLKGGVAFKVPKQRLWIDTDAACGAGDRVDVDDCFALLLLLRSPQVSIAGISTVFGNAPVDVTDRTAHELLVLLGSPTPASIVYRGATAPISDSVRTAAAPAQTALREALKKGPLTIVALGPLTNIALSLQGHPEVQGNVAAIVAVMGHRKGHLFHPAEGKGKTWFLFGHGPVFTDFNFAQDRAAARSLVAMHLPLFLVPYDAAREVVLNAADLDRMTGAGGASRWVAERSREWLRYWNDEIGLMGFYPFDLIAAAYVVQPGFFDCARADTWIAPDPMFRWIPAPDSLLIGLDREKPKKFRASGKAVYCPQINTGLHDWLIERLTER
jgi:purine nucleosidase